MLHVDSGLYLFLQVVDLSQSLKYHKSERLHFKSAARALLTKLSQPKEFRASWRDQDRALLVKFLALAKAFICGGSDLLWSWGAACVLNVEQVAVKIYECLGELGDEHPDWMHFRPQLIFHHDQLERKSCQLSLGGLVTIGRLAVL